MCENMLNKNDLFGIRFILFIFCQYNIGRFEACDCSFYLNWKYVTEFVVLSI